MARIGVDVGGTFTDLVLEVEGEGRNGQRIFLHKVASTPADQSEGVLKGVLEICGMAGISPADVRMIVHGTTVATNMLLERAGARVALVATEGYTDVLQIGRASCRERV